MAHPITTEQIPRRPLNVLVVTQYFPPEPGACPNRLGTFVDGLVARGHAVTVICEQPNYPDGVFRAGFGNRPVVTERSDGRTIRRLWVYASPRTTTAARLAFYGTFAAGAGVACALEPRHDVVFATSPPLPSAFSVAAAAKLRRWPLVLDVRDIWPAAAEAVGELSNRRLLRALERGERWLYRAAAAVTTTTRPFCAHIDGVAGGPRSVHLPNGAPDELLELPSPDRPDSATFVVGYAGNFGLAQGLGIVLDAADRLRGEDVRFALLGDGPLAAELAEERERRDLDSVTFRPPVPVGEVGDFLVSCDALLVTLRNHPTLEDFVPSKLFDAMAVGRPVVLAAAGESAALVGESGCGVVVPPGDGGALAEAVRRLAADRSGARRMGRAGRQHAMRNTRTAQVDRLEEVLLEAASGARPAPN